MDKMTTDYVSPAQLAATLGVCHDTITRWRRAGRLPQPIRIGRTTRYHMPSVLEWVAQYNNKTEDK